MEELIGFLGDEGYDAAQIAEMLALPEDMIRAAMTTVHPPATGTARLARVTPTRDVLSVAPLKAAATPATERAKREGVVRKVLTVAQGRRKRPGRQAVAIPAPAAATPVRVDTEQSYRAFRQVMNAPSVVSPFDDPAANALADLTPEALEAIALREQRGAPYISGGGVPIVLGAAQACLCCGKDGCRTVICAACRNTPALVGGEFGGLLERADALAAPTGDAPQARVPLSLDAHAPGDDVEKHTSTFAYGPNLYASVRLTGWDREPRILTASEPLLKSLGIVCGYAEEANISTEDLRPVALPLARQLGASALIPRLCAGAPELLHEANGRQVPYVTAITPRAE